MTALIEQVRVLVCDRSVISISVKVIDNKAKMVEVLLIKRRLNSI